MTANLAHDHGQLRTLMESWPWVSVLGGRGRTLVDAWHRGLQNRLRSSADVRSSRFHPSASAAAEDDSQWQPGPSTRRDAATRCGLAAPPCHRRFL